MTLEEEVVNSCRVCRSPNRDGDYECLYAVQVIEECGIIQSHAWQLTETGKLYEDMLGVEIDASTMEMYPQYLCNSCDLQMRLFRKLTLRARRTLEELENIYEAVSKHSKIEKNSEKIESGLGDINPATLNEEFLESSISAVATEGNPEVEALLAETNLVEQLPNDVSLKEEQALGEYAPQASSHLEEAAIESTSNDGVNALKGMALPDNGVSCYKEPETTAQQVVRHTDGVHDTKEIEFVSLFDENSEHEENALQQEIVEFFDVHYLDENMAETNSSCIPIQTLERTIIAGVCSGIRRAYECQACGLEFLRRTDFLQHRKSAHSNKFQCPHCPKLLQTNDALRVHLRLHSGEPAYKCEICKRTFNQKVHYRYHMDRHNNVRNFRCTQCEKAFLSKHDLTVHMRSHTGERPYECEICGKDFLILQHLKMHRYSHFGKSFECHVCKQKFISPSTLRIHLQSIHNGERRFQCELCVKRFRRKHHLLAHYKVHKKNDANPNEADHLTEGEDNGYQLVDSDEHHQPLIEEETVGNFLEINADDQMDGILIVDDEDGEGDAIYGDDYVIGVTDDGVDMTF